MRRLYPLEFPKPIIGLRVAQNAHPEIFENLESQTNNDSNVTNVSSEAAPQDFPDSRTTLHSGQLHSQCPAGSSKASFRQRSSVCEAAIAA